MLLSQRLPAERTELYYLRAIAPALTALARAANAGGQAQ